VSEQFESRLEESRDVMRDLALPPGYRLGKDPDGTFMVVKEHTSEIFAVDGSEENLPHVVVDLWREYVAEAAPSEVARLVHCMTAVDAMLSWNGELKGDPRARAHTLPDKINYECTLWGAEDDGIKSVSGSHDDPIEAVLKARRAMIDSLAEPEHDDELDHEEGAEADE
jgi:hypothetical protein